MADLPTVLAFGLAGLAVVVWTAVLVVALRRRRPAGKRSLAADVPSGPVVSGAELIEATWLHSRRFPDPDPYPYVWRNRYRGGHREHRTGAVCDRTAVDEVHRGTEEVAG